MNAASTLEKTVDNFCNFITSLPASALVEQEWGPREVLAHLVYHHELYVRLVQASMSGFPMTHFKGRFREMNAEAVAESRGVTTDELLERLERANLRLIDFYRQHDPNAIRVEIKAGAKIRTLAELVPEVEAHIRNHQEKLRKGLKARIIRD